MSTEFLGNICVYDEIKAIGYDIDIVNIDGKRRIVAELITEDDIHGRTEDS
jgi:hypothetical protein